METSDITPKEMVIATLEESKTPLMAKKIAYKIYNKYNGYRLSRFMVRDILWKELRGQYEYDNVNYTYWINKKDYSNIELVPSIKDDLNESKLVVDNHTPYSREIGQSELLSQFNNCQGKDVIHAFKNFVKSNFLNVHTGNKKFDQLITLIVKDNKITLCEEAFLKQKTLELGLPYNLIEKAKEMLNSNNPYLDNIIHIIFEDGKITDEELLFLKEKEMENDFSKSFVNQRFWQIGVCYYLKELTQIKDFDKIIKLWHIGNTLGFNLINIDSWLFIKLDIHGYNKIDKIIAKSVNAIEVELLTYVKKKFDYGNNQVLNDLYGKINLVNQIQEPTKARVDKNFTKDVLKILDEEKLRLGSPDANLLVENVKFRMENNLWD